MSDASYSKDHYAALRAWYLAQLRSSALESTDSNLTPLALIRADRKVIERLIAEKSAEQAAVGARAGTPGQIEKLAAMELGTAHDANNPLPKWIEQTSLTRSLALTVLIMCAIQVIPLCLLADVAARAGAASQASSAVVWLAVFSIALCLICPAVLCWLIGGLVFGRINRLNRCLLLRPDLVAPGCETKNKNEIAALEELTYSLSRALDEASERETAIADYSINLLVCLDQNACILATSHSVAKVWNYHPGQLIGMALKDITDADDVEKTQRALDTARKSEGKVELENRIVCGNGQKKDMLWSLEWSPTHQSLFCVASDITARKQIERLKEEFLAMISHDLRTPLAAVLGSMQLLEALLDAGEEKLSDRCRQLLSISQHNVARLLGLVNEILDAEKLSAGKLVMDFADCNWHDVIKTSVESVQGLADQQDIKLVWHADQAVTRADAGRLVQAIVNLLSNAVKFSPAGSTVTVTLERDDKAITVKIADQGPGIAAKYKDQIFQRFQQLGAISSLPGTGLGLTICRDIVKAHNGEIGFDSQEGKGSTFWIKLPAV